MNDYGINGAAAQEAIEAMDRAEEAASFIEVIENADAKEIEGLLNCEIPAGSWLGNNSDSSYSIDEDGWVWLLDVFGDEIEEAGQVSPETLERLIGAR